jgi:hypothetical protein
MTILASGATTVGALAALYLARVAIQKLRAVAPMVRDPLLGGSDRGAGNWGARVHIGCRQQGRGL